MKSANYLLSCLSFCLLLLLESSSATSCDNGPSVELTRRAISLGIEAAVLSELWRNKQPVITSKSDELGQLFETTYELTPDCLDIVQTSVKAEQPPISTTTEPSTTSSTSSTTTTSTTSTASTLLEAEPTNPHSDWEYVGSNPDNRRSFVPNYWPSLPRPLDWPSFSFPAGVTPQTSTKTELDDQGNRVTTTIHSYSGPSDSWPSFSPPAGITPQTSTKTEKDDQGRTLTTHTRTYQSPVFTRWVTSPLPASWQPEPAPLPWHKNPFIGTIPAATETQPLPGWAQPIPSGGQWPLPVSTAPLLPTQPSTVSTQLDAQPTTRTRLTSYSGSFSGAAPPRIAELAPSLRDLLTRGGITDEDVRNAQEQGKDIVHTHYAPDGSVISTKVRVNQTPAAAAAPPVAQFPHLPQLPQFAQRDRSIENYLAQVQLRPEDIEAQNGELIKTIIDQNGRVLSIRFVLSSVKGEDNLGQAQGQPTK